MTIWTGGSSRRQASGWAVSIAIHATIVLCAAWLMMEVEPPPAQPVFRWEVALVNQPAPESVPEHVPDVSPTNPTEAPNIVERPQQVVKPATSNRTKSPTSRVVRVTKQRPISRPSASQQRLQPRKVKRAPTRTAPRPESARQSLATVTVNAKTIQPHTSQTKATQGPVPRVRESRKPKVENAGVSPKQTPAAEPLVASVEKSAAKIVEAGTSLSRTTDERTLTVAQVDGTDAARPARASTRLVQRSESTVQQVSNRQQAKSEAERRVEPVSRNETAGESDLPAAVSVVVPATAEAQIALAQVLQIGALTAPTALRKQPTKTVGRVTAQLLDRPIGTTAASPLADAVITNTTPETLMQPPSKSIDSAQAAKRSRSSAQITTARAAPRTRADYGWLAKEMHSRVAREKRYPFAARVGRLEGKVVLRAVIRDDGNLADVKVEHSSGHAVLDREAMDLVRRVCPLALKHPLGRPQVVMHIPITYSLR